MQEDRCLVSCIHEDVIQKITGVAEPNEYLERLAQLFKVLGDPTRVRIIYALMQHELCVCDLAHILQMSQSSISHQLRLLRQNQIVKKRREGKIMFYTLADDFVTKLFVLGMEHGRNETYKEYK